MPARGRDRRDPGLRARLAIRLRSRRAIVVDRSMEPTLRPGDRLLYDPRAYATVPPKIGDLVLFDDPDGSGRRLIKRVVALPGDLVGPTDRGVELRASPGAPPDGMGDRAGRWRIPPSHCFVLAERTLEGRDSRAFGPVRFDRLLGRAWFRYAPGSRRGPLAPSTWDRDMP